MHKPGITSLWIGRAESEAAVRAIVEARTTDTGDRIPTPFELTFGTGPYDPDSAQVVWGDGYPHKAWDLLRKAGHGVAYATHLEAQGVDLDIPCTCLIVLHDFEYDGRVRDAVVESVRLRFLGAVTIEE